MQQTIDAICEAAATSPLSIVIIGVGDADFTAMEQIDGDKNELCNSAGEPAQRDIVQFVPFNKYKLNGTRLAKETMAEIPGQIVQYFKSRNIHPRPPIPPPMYDEIYY
eukprot:CAMPEP_0171320068 /NCGR_PEP_ID=MMETSP0816-20121228/101589_1 /TAXON_ID=420281 /ORGANISM="Proboscia inermis, Strain CCAP1064/1" /LENGTH=107 /DNA_ID=CAMNT_0011816503 /DNA_START=95 /DNA_END=418 /DNA_ORIENTATION=-